MQKYKIIALIGEAGSGKDFLLRCAKSKYKEYNEIISCTTRPQRMGEVDGVNYYYLTNEQFTERIARNKMLEWTEFNNWFYGTSTDSLDIEKINIGVFNPGGIKNLLARNDVDVKVFYVRAPAKERLIRQLQREDDPDVDEVLRRYEADEKDFWNLPFGYTNIENSTIKDVDAALDQLVWNPQQDDIG